MASLPSAPFALTLVGAGRVGTAVAALLQQRGHRVVGVASRTEASAVRGATRLEAPVVSVGGLPECGVILLGVPEHTLAGVTAELPGATNAVIVHLAGSVGIEPVRRSLPDAVVCALHPVQACPDVDTAMRRLPGSAWGVTCSEGATAWAHRLIAEDLSGRPVDVGEEHRAVWHAAAVTTSNGISALMATGEALLSSIGISSPADVLGPISAGTVANAREVGGGAPALTGPVVRRETEVIRKHVAAVRERAPRLLDAYLHALRSIVASAAASGRIERSDAESLMTLLEPQ